MILIFESLKLKQKRDIGSSSLKGRLGSHSLLGLEKMTGFAGSTFSFHRDPQNLNSNITQLARGNAVAGPIFAFFTNFLNGLRQVT